MKDEFSEETTLLTLWYAHLRKLNGIESMKNNIEYNSKKDIFKEIREKMGPII